MVLVLVREGCCLCIISPNAVSTTPIHHSNWMSQLRRGRLTGPFFLYPKARVGHQRSVNHVYSVNFLGKWPGLLLEVILGISYRVMKMCSCLLFRFYLYLFSYFRRSYLPFPCALCPIFNPVFELFISLFPSPLFNLLPPFAIFTFSNYNISSSPTSLLNFSFFVAFSVAF